MVITSLLDNDLYKFTMHQWFWANTPGSTAAYEMFPRGTEFPDGFAERLREEVSWLSVLRFTKRDIDYLRSLSFRDDYLEYLSTFRLDPDNEVVIVNNDPKPPTVRIKGNILKAMMYEIYILSIIAQLRSDYTLRNMGACNREEFIAKSKMRFEKKNATFSVMREHNPTSPPNIVDFGTRRRFTKDWQQYILDEARSWLIGTSNVFFSRHQGLPAIGTMAHEYFMAWQSIVLQRGGELKDFQKSALTAWKAMYGDKYSIALTDTIGIDAFLADVNPHEWDGFRHDSGCPFEFANKVIEFLVDEGIDPKTKTIVFSDELNPEKVRKLWLAYHEHVKLVFGIGTNLMNDMERNKQANPVIKMTEFDGVRVFKLSDEPGKWTAGIGDLLPLLEAFNISH